MKSQNGMTVLETNRTTGPLPRLRSWWLPGIAGRRLLLRDGSVGFVLCHLALWFHETIEPLNQGILDDWGWAVRPVRGQVSGYSNHAAGAAEDLNATKHPRGVGLQTFKKAGQVARIRARLLFYAGVIRWGGDYEHSPKDAMHFEVVKPLSSVEKLALRLANTPRGKRLLLANTGAWEVISSGTKMEGKPRPGSKPAPKPKPPAPKPPAPPTPGPVVPPKVSSPILRAGTLHNPPSDHEAVWADLTVKGVTFRVATANVRDTPHMPLPQATACVKRVQSIANVTVAGFNEFQRRRLASMLKDGWRAVQHDGTGDKARAPLAYDPDVWTATGSPIIRQLSHARVGALSVSSGNRYATAQILTHRAGVKVAFVSFHAIAHMNVGAHFGWTGKGPRALLALHKLRPKMANPAITVFKEGMKNLEKLVAELAPQVDAVVVMGDLNFDAAATLKATHPEPSSPEMVFRRLGMTTVFSSGALKHGTAGNRQIDYVAVTKEKA